MYYKEKFKIKKLLISTWSKGTELGMLWFHKKDTAWGKKIMPENCFEKFHSAATPHSSQDWDYVLFLPKDDIYRQWHIWLWLPAYLPYCFVCCTVIFLIIHIRKIPGTWQPLQDFSFLHSHLGQKTLHPFRSKNKQREAIKQLLNLLCQFRDCKCWIMNLL